MAILETDIAQVRLSSDLVEVISEHVALRKVGRRWMGLCPFHGEKSPSFSVNAEEGLWYCFGCHKRGDVITFVRELEHDGFVKAVESLADRYGIDLRYDESNVAAQDRKRKALLSSAMERAVEWYHERLLYGHDARPARSYLRDRGYDSGIVRHFRLGWAPAGWDELARDLKLPTDVARDTGLGFVNRRGHVQDAFRNRILFPIFDSAGVAMAFGGRILPGGEGPKYKNSPETPLYAKSRTLYGLNWAKANVVERNEVVVCEGYTDVIGFSIAGISRAVATCGTALTDDHVRQLKNFASRIVLAYDADTAGQAAVERFYEWEQKLSIDIAVAVLPKGTDPADSARNHPGHLRQSVEKARGFLAFRIDRVLQGTDLHNAEQRARAAELCVAMIAEHPSQFLREQYIMMVASSCRVPEESLRRALASGKGRAIDIRKGASGKTPPFRLSGVDGETRAESEALRVAIHQPQDVARVLDSFAPSGGFFEKSRGIEEILFVDQVARSAFRSLVEAPTLLAALDMAPPEAADLLARLAVEEDEGSASDVFVRLVDRAAQRVVHEVEAEARTSAEGYGELASVIAWLKLTTERLRQQSTSLEAAAALVAWLVEQPEQVP